MRRRPERLGAIALVYEADFIFLSDVETCAIDHVPLFNLHFITTIYAHPVEAEDLEEVEGRELIAKCSPKEPPKKNLMLAAHLNFLQLACA